MASSISYVQSAAEALRKLDWPTVRRLLETIGNLADDPRPPGCLQLKGGAGELRYRVGDYRITYEVRDQELVVLVLRVGHRREVYRGGPRLIELGDGSRCANRSPDREAPQCASES